MKTRIANPETGASNLVATQTPSNPKKKYAIKAIAEWLSRSTDEEIGLMDVVVLEELIDQARESEETTEDLSD